MQRQSRSAPYVYWLLACCCVRACGNEPTLADAIERQDKESVRELLADQVDVNLPQADGTTALHWSVYLEDVETTRAIIRAGGNIHSENRYGVPPLSLACTNGNTEIVELLLDNGADPNGSLPGGETVLMTAARTGKVAPVLALLAKGADVNAKERNRQTALMWAAAEGNIEVVKALLDAGADFLTPLKSGYTPMMFAVREGHIPVVRELLAKGVDVNAVMEPENSSGRSVERGTSALILAIENGHFELAAELLKAGADPNDQRTGFSPLHTLSWVRKPPIGDNVDGDPPPIGSGNLTSLQFVRVLVQHGADINLRKREAGGRNKFGHQGTTAFLCAAGTADLAFMRTLLDLGADPTIPNEKLWTPLFMAAGMGTGSSGDSAGTEEECLAAVRFLIELGADVNAIDKDGETAMHGAAYKMMPSVVKLLAESGADINIWNKESDKGRTPLSIAQGYRGGGNFKPSYETVAAIEQIMLAQGVTPPPPPKPVREKGYRAN